ncbi:peptidoglycan synthetase [Arcobacter vandammei]|uniref:peptidoglycan synthetase n=1 Tax=Arcobacter vandammei TaxID=2782243 RepID=UPI0018DFEA49|nr:peptidoglycan synthetase [Arcobacter vandammei]
MKISSIVDIIDGELLNSPSISFINDIKTDVNKVKTSDLFIAKNLVDLKESIQNGAYAVIFEEDFPILDSEVAFIKVKDLNLSIIKLLRYKLSNLKLEAFFCKDDSFDMLKLYYQNHKKPIFLVPKNIEKMFRFIDEIKENNILISKNQEILTSIYPKNEKFEKDISKKEITNLIKHSLFEISFSYKNHYFSRIKLANIYIDSFLNIFNFFNKDIDISKLKNYSNFKAIFIDKNFEPIDFGKSDRFIICQNNINLVEIEKEYLNSEFKYAKTIFISKNSIKNLDEIKDILKNQTFNCAYLIGFSYKEIFEYLQKSQNSPTLF